MTARRIMRYLFPFLSFILATLASPRAHAQDVPVTYLYGSGTSANDELGWSLALHGDTLLVGAPYDHYMDPPDISLTGRVYAFRRTAAGAWEEFDLWLPMLAADFQVGGGGFGNALALAPGGRLAAVGARGTTYTDGQDCCQGAVYLFRYDEDEAVWVREGRVRDLDTRDYAQLGTMVAVAGDLVATNGEWNGRSLVVFRHVPGADDGGDGPGGYAFGPWVEEATFTTGEVSGFLSTLGQRKLAAADHAEEGERVVGGASYEDTANGGDAGAVYVYRNDGPAGGPAAWTLEARIEPSDAAAGVRFGAAVALSADGRFLLVGAPGRGADDRGGAYVLRREGAGPASAWVEEAVLAPGTVGATGFGLGVALSEDPGTGEPLALVVNRSFASPEAALFRREADGAGGHTWEEVASFGEDFDGFTVALSGLVAAAGDWDDGTRGARAGRALVFDVAQVVPNEPGPEPPPALILSASPNPSQASVALALVLPEAAHVRVALYDGLGREVALVHEGPLGAGAHRLALDVRGLPAGVYLARVEAAGDVATVRLAVIH